jgi:hypothetical protein
MACPRGYLSTPPLPIGTRCFLRSFFVLALLTAFHPAFAQSATADPHLGAWLGAWKLVSAQSTLAPPNRLSVTPLKDGAHVVMSGETHLDFTTNSKEQKSAAPGNLGFNQIELHRTDKRQAEVKEEKDGALVATIREKLSDDASELTTTTTSAGKPDQVTVWTRTGGAKDGKDLFAGDWTQDLSKTRVRQGLVLKIEPDGAGGIRFVGDFIYTARFDGKQYDVKNSRNDTVSLQLVDARTVDATYQRDNQVTQKDRWQVSPDGQQMTLTSTATLETGQKLTEKLSFKKQ